MPVRPALPDVPTGSMALYLKNKSNTIHFNLHPFFHSDLDQDSLEDCGCRKSDVLLKLKKYQPLTRLPSVAWTRRGHLPQRQPTKRY